MEAPLAEPIYRLCVLPARLGHGEDYKYAHNFPDHFVPQDYLGAAKRYYEATEQGAEKKIKERLDKWRAQIEALRK